MAALEWCLSWPTEEWDREAVRTNVATDSNHHGTAVASVSQTVPTLERAKNRKAKDVFEHARAHKLRVDSTLSQYGIKKLQSRDTSQHPPSTQLAKGGSKQSQEL